MHCTTIACTSSCHLLTCQTAITHARQTAIFFMCHAAIAHMCQAAMIFACLPMVPQPCIKLQSCTYQVLQLCVYHVLFQRLTGPSHTHFAQFIFIFTTQAFCYLHGVLPVQILLYHSNYTYSPSHFMKALALFGTALTYSMSQRK